MLPHVLVLSSKTAGGLFDTFLYIPYTLLSSLYTRQDFLSKSIKSGTYFFLSKQHQFVEVAL